MEEGMGQAQEQEGQVVVEEQVPEGAGLGVGAQVLHQQVDCPLLSLAAVPALPQRSLHIRQAVATVQHPHRILPLRLPLPDHRRQPSQLPFDHAYPVLPPALPFPHPRQQNPLLSHQYFLWQMIVQSIANINLFFDMCVRVMARYRVDGRRRRQQKLVDDSCKQKQQNGESQAEGFGG